MREAGYQEVTGQLKKIAGLPIAGPKGTLGDIDVFVVDRQRQRLLLLECKDLVSARTPSELSNEMQTLLEGEKSIVALHGRRVHWFETHKTQILEHLAVEVQEHWTVMPLIVVDTELMAASFAESPLPVMPLHQLLDVLAQ